MPSRDTRPVRLIHRAAECRDRAARLRREAAASAPALGGELLAIARQWDDIADTLDRLGRWRA